jgi:Ni/Co efflux regulator RcnB
MWKESVAVTVIASLGAFGAGNPGPALGRIDIKEKDMWNKPAVVLAAFASLGLLGAQAAPAQTAPATDVRQEDRQADRQQDRQADRQQDRQDDRRVDRREDRRADRRDDSTERPEHMERPERMERAERADRPDRSGRH